MHNDIFCSFIICSLERNLYYEYKFAFKINIWSWIFKKKKFLSNPVLCQSKRDACHGLIWKGCSPYLECLGCANSILQYVPILGEHVLKTMRLSTQVCNLGHTVRLHIISPPWASRMSSYHSCVVVRQTDLHGPPNIEAPMFSKQLNPEDGQKQNKQTAGLAWALLPSTISASAWSRCFWLCFHTALWNFIQCWAPTLHTKLNRLTSSPSPGVLLLVVTRVKLAFWRVHKFISLNFSVYQ